MRSICLGFICTVALASVQAQTYLPCSTLPPTFYCNSVAWFDTLDVMTDSTLIVLDTSGQNSLWQRGLADKLPFNWPAPVSGLVTDSVNSYPPSNTSHFIVKIPGITGEPTNLFFEHRFETDSLLDGGYLSFSCDHGLNWEYVGFLSGQFVVPMSMNYENYPVNDGFSPSPTLHGNIPAFTGNGGNWQWSAVQWFWYPPVMRPDDSRGGGGCAPWNMDTLYVRFTFESDDIDSQKGGWMIRNIVTGGNDLGSGIDYLSSGGWLISPNPVSTHFSLQGPASMGLNYSITDLSGRTLQSGIAAPHEAIDISSFVPGIYAVLLEQNGTTKALRLVKQ